jgi:hypothetical protein
MTHRQRGQRVEYFAGNVAEMDVDWGALLVSQLEFYWDVHLRPRLDGLTDEEYFWEPVDGCWSVRPDTEGRFSSERVKGVEPPLTTIAWRMMHVAIGVFGARASTFFGDGSVPADADMFDPRHSPASEAGTAAEAVALLEHNYHWWHDGIAGLSYTELTTPLGPRGAMFAEAPMADLIIHLNREAMHHGGEIALLRDLYRATGATSRADRLRVGR